MKLTETPKKLYQYKKFDFNSITTLCLGLVYYSNPKDFNDPLDCHPTIYVDIDCASLEKLCHQMINERKNSNDSQKQMAELRYLSTDPEASDQANYYFELLANEIKTMLWDEFGSKGVFCLSKNWNCPLMWSHYADDHRGLCIEYDAKLYPHEKMNSVNYNNPRSIKASDLFHWKIENCNKSREIVYDTYFFSKSQKWCYEKEWREISDSSGLLRSNFPITSIYFGLRCDYSVVVRVVKLLSNLEQCPNLYQIYPLNETFRLRRRCVDKDEILACGIKPSLDSMFKDVIHPVG
jgi:hypothetical protein